MRAKFPSKPCDPAARTAGIVVTLSLRTGPC